MSINLEPPLITIRTPDTRPFYDVSYESEDISEDEALRVRELFTDTCQAVEGNSWKKPGETGSTVTMVKRISYSELPKDVIGFGQRDGYIQFHVNRSLNRDASSNDFIHVMEFAGKISPQWRAMSRYSIDQEDGRVVRQDIQPATAHTIDMENDLRRQWLASKGRIAQDDREQQLNYDEKVKYLEDFAKGSGREIDEVVREQLEDAKKKRLGEQAILNGKSLYADYEYRKPKKDALKFEKELGMNGQPVREGEMKALAELIQFVFGNKDDQEQ